MLVSHWMKAGVILLWLVTTAWVLNQCDRLLAPAGPPKAKAKEEPPKDDASRVMDDHAKLRADKRKAHEEKLARRRAEHQALERDLVTMIQTDIPSALAELAKAASRFRNKLSDLKHLKKADQWEREAPVKDALARAREFTTEWYRIDLEAQKGREGPTLHSPADIADLTKRIDLFKRGGEEIEPFAGTLALLHGKVPESLMLSAIDAIPHLVLPKDAFDPCSRNAAACPKPPPTPVAADFPWPGLMSNVKRPSGPIYCVARQPLAPRTVALHEEPTPDSLVVAHVPAGSCELIGTGMRGFHETPFARDRWLEVVDRDGNRGWVTARYLRHRR